MAGQGTIGGSRGQPAGGRRVGEPDLSVVVPARNEAHELPGLLADLGRQEGIGLEVVVADGGSRDGTPEVARRAGARVVPAPPGRGRQMNAGARAARARDLLFLHADTRLPDPRTLVRARAALGSQGGRVAGHFGIRFRDRGPGREGAYYFYEAKTRTNRPGTIHGDQGIWIRADYFRELGGFDEALPFLEDERLVRRVFETGRWVLLPGTLETSARRFEAEGLEARQALNALILAADDLGLEGFLARAPALYREQGEARRLRLAPFLAALHAEGRAGGWGAFLRRWLAAGRFVARNAWQVGFALDCRRNRRAGHPPGEGPFPWTRRFDRWAGVFESRPAAAAAALLTAGAFYALWAHGRCFRR
ncbi:MAG: TIGR04283 family arsenosugar biosynthesis glycosyltransferase [Deferrisoma sp.]